MDTRIKRFYAALSICQSKSKETIQSSESSNLSGWDFRKADHPLDGNKMAIADRSMTIHGDYDPSNYSIRYLIRLYLTAVRLASSTEVSAGFNVWLSGRNTDPRHFILDQQSSKGMVYSYDTAPAYQRYMSNAGQMGFRFRHHQARCRAFQGNSPSSSMYRKRASSSWSKCPIDGRRESVRRQRMH